MRLLYEANEAYPHPVEELIRLAFSCVPREHLRQLDGVYVTDFDPKGERLGVYERDHCGNRITLYVWPHVLDVQRTPPERQAFTLALHLAHTLFHEVGHHVTLTLNPRRAPSKKREKVTDTLEKWAEQYVAKRLTRFRTALQESDLGPMAQPDTPCYAEGA